MADKKGRVAQIIKKDLTDIILYELKSPVVKFSSLNRVEVTSDYSYCKVYISDLDPNKTDSIVAFLNNNSKKIRSMLAKKLDIYKTPALIFVADKDYEKDLQMKLFLEEVNNRKPVTLADAFKEEKPKKSTTKKSTTKKTTTKNTATKKASPVKAKKEEKSE